MHHFCVLCGVRLASCPRPLEGVPPQRLGWQHEIRAGKASNRCFFARPPGVSPRNECLSFLQVRSERGRSSPSLTGVGILESGSLLAWSDANISYMNPQRDLVRHYLYYSPSTKAWTFAFHDSCWRILLEKMSLMLNCWPGSQQVAELLFRLLYCLPFNHFYVPCPSHDFGGSLRFWKSPLNLPKSYKFLLADPCTLGVYTHSANDSLATEFSQSPLQFHASTECFLKLSREMIHLIVSFLDSRDLCTLRLASKVVASLTGPNVLPQFFWQSRFAVDKEMGFFPREDESFSFWSPGRDWRKLYFDLKYTLRDETEASHMRNRRRIWYCLDHLTCCLIPLLDQKPLLQDRKSIELDLLTRGYEATQLAQGPVLPDCSGPTGMGTRLFGFQYLIFCPQSLGAGLGIEVSLSRVTFDGAEYICGIRVYNPGQFGAIKEISRVGHILPHSEDSISVPPQHRVTGIRVAASACGIVGLGLRVENDMGHIVWETAGLVTEPPEGIGVATLEPRNGFQLSGAIIGLDETPVPWFWHPNEPNTTGHGVILPSTAPQEETIDPIFVLNMNFGGPGGSLLSRLTRITALHDDRYGSFRGFAFSYIDGSRSTFGTRMIRDAAGERWNCIEQSFALDGPGGERIISLESEPDRSCTRDCLEIIRLFTNHGRALEFRRTRGPSEILESHQGQRLVPPPGVTISAILATVQMSSGALQSLGLHYAENMFAKTPGFSPRLPTLCDLRTKEPCSFENNYEKWIKAPRALQNSNGCFSSVILSDIRRVAVSIGMPDQTRGASHIAGLCFEFWSSNKPVYVGQWYHEVSCLHLKPGERITGFTFWQQQESSPNSSQRENSGRIAGIGISKTGAGQRELKLQFGDEDDMLSYSFTENPYEKLAGLAWAFNHECDYTRTPGKLFWRLQNDEGNSCAVSRIHAFFCCNSARLSGFVFEYGSCQVSRHAGYICGLQSSMTIEIGEFITRMDVLTGNGVDEVVFHTNRNKVHALSASGSSHQPRHQESSDFEVFELSDLEELNKTNTEASRISDKPSEMTGKCVGIWLTMKIFPRATNVIEAVGPILTTRNSSISQGS
ncbi:hypothetical protein F66182_8302 [Fusarium sp. NRRL 66182]|nr:hypothetical protein F66182_8302 [Fusarium sp. NRRL 66182]